MNERTGRQRRALIARAPPPRGGPAQMRAGARTGAYSHRRRFLWSALASANEDDFI